MAGQEQIIRKASLIGNGAHIFVPKEWAGEEIVLTRKPKKPMREMVLDVLEPYLEDISGAFLFGSYARGEARTDSDVDLFVVSNKKIKIKKRGFGVVCVQEGKFENALDIAPVIIYSMLSEAKPIINAGFLERLREKYKPKLNDFRDFLEDCHRAIKINESLLEEEDKEYTENTASAYSLILRLRGAFIIRCLLAHKEYSKTLFKDWINSNLPDVDFDSIYNSYVNVKIGRNGRRKLKIKDLLALLELLRKEVNKLRDGKKKKATGERH